MYCLGVRQGFGLHTAADGVVYSGQWYNDLPHGPGVLAVNMGDVKFSGTFDAGSLHGFVEMTKVDGSVEKGFWIHGKREGLFLLDRHDSTSWLSTWKDNAIHGEWQMVWSRQDYHYLQNPRDAVNTELAGAIGAIRGLVTLKRIQSN
jgi:hypothetical protein